MMMNAILEFDSYLKSGQTVLNSTAWHSLTPELSDLHDEDLMAMVVEENTKAFETLMERHLYRVTKLATRIVYVVGDADDVAQEVFINMWKRKETWLNWRSSFTTWLYRITVHKCIDLNKKARYSNLEDTQEPVSTDLDAFSQLHLLQFNKQLNHAISTLSKGQKLAVSLHYSEGMTAQECASVLGLKKCAVEALLKRARQKIRELLDEADILGDCVDAPNQIQLSN